MRYKKTIIAGTALVATYALVGFFALPPIVKPRLIKAIESSTHRKGNLGEVRINPFTLSIELKDFALKDLDSSPLLSFRDMYINYEIRSLFQHAYVFSE